jgi:hypothetical protein
MITILIALIACEVKSPEQYAIERHEHYVNDMAQRLIKYKPEEGVTCYLLPTSGGTSAHALSCFPEPRVVLLPPGPAAPKAR